MRWKSGHSSRQGGQRPPTHQPTATCPLPHPAGYMDGKPQPQSPATQEPSTPTFAVANSFALADILPDALPSPISPHLHLSRTHVPKMRLLGNRQATSLLTLLYGSSDIGPPPIAVADC